MWCSAGGKKGRRVTEGVEEKARPDGKGGTVSIGYRMSDRTLMLTGSSSISLPPPYSTPISLPTISIRCSKPISTIPGETSSIPSRSG